VIAARALPTKGCLPTKDDFLLPAGRAYLDSAATTMKPRVVVDAVQRWYAALNANIHRGLYPRSLQASEAYEETRRKIARFLNTPARHLIFTSGTTDSLNLLAQMLEERLGEGDEILLTPLEHHANIIPWQEAARQRGAKVVFSGINKDGTLDVEGFRRALTPHTRVVAITHVSNVTGEVLPLDELIPAARAAGAFVVVDGAQAVPHLPVDLGALGCDAYAWSGHKAYGPTGTGVLYLKDLSLRPARTGGDMIDDVTEHEATFAEDGPRRFEAGTPNLAGIHGLGAAITFLEAVGMEQVWEHGQHLLMSAWKELGKLGVRFLGPPPETGRRAPLLTFTLDAPPHDAAELLAEHGVDVRAGMHCAHPLHRRLGLNGTIRASFGLSNDDEDVARLVRAVKSVLEAFR